MSNVVSILRISDGRLRISLPVGTSPTDIYYDGTSMWVTDDAMASVYKITRNH